MKDVDIKLEATRLWKLGCGVLWLRPGSKAPIRKKWAQAEREDLKTLLAGYQQGFGLGISMGRNSRLEDGYYLANIDVDVKGRDERYWGEALAAVESRFPGITGAAPRVKTGFGVRYFVKTKKPAESGKITASGENCRVKLPSTPAGGAQQTQLSAEELKAGWRIRVAWEVDFMSEGRQVVVPPTVHPDTGRAYVWENRFTSCVDLPVIKADGIKRGRGRPAGSTVVQNFEPVDVDLSRLPWDVRLMIEEAEDPLTGPLVDRSAALMTIVHAMVAQRYSDMEIMSALTDEAHLISGAALERRGSRGGAAAWIRDHTLTKVKDKRSAARAFAVEVEVGEPLGEAEASEQTRELVSKDWRRKLKRGGKYGDGAILPSIANTVLVLQNAVAPDIFRRNAFSFRDSYGVKAPWFGGDDDKAVTDDDVIAVREWLHMRHGFEPSKPTASDAVTMIAVQNAYHPVIDELQALPAWDGVERLDGWLAAHFGAKGNTEYLAQVFRKWMVASVTRVFAPGSKFDWLPIFQGAQGTGKSSFGRILFGDAYFNDWLPALHDKDAALGLQGIRCQEFSELESMRKNELETLKAFVTRTVDKVRPPYGQRSVEIPRQCVFFGTTNLKKAYLRDDTGNRRFNPVEVGQLDFKRLAAERDQLWAEALFIHDNGLEPHLYLEGEAAIAAVQAQESKMVRSEADLMADVIVRALERPESGLFPWDKFKLFDLFSSGPLAPTWKLSPYNEAAAAKAIELIRMRTKYHIKHWKSGTMWWAITPEMGR